MDLQYGLSFQKWKTVPPSMFELSSRTVESDSADATSANADGCSTEYTCTISGLEPGKYAFRVRAKNVAGESEWSKNSDYLIVPKPGKDAKDGESSPRSPGLIGRLSLRSSGSGGSPVLDEDDEAARQEVTRSKQKVLEKILLALHP